jgi:hypothetical protein
MSGNDDGDEPWSEDDLFDLDSALSFGACIEEIAVFLRREVEDVERKVFERNRRTQDRFAGTKASIGGRASGLADPEGNHQALEDRTPETMHRIDLDR